MSRVSQATAWQHTPGRLFFFLAGSWPWRKKTHRNGLLPVVRQWAQPEVLRDPKERRVPQNVEVQNLRSLQDVPRVVYRLHLLHLLLLLRFEVLRVLSTGPPGSRRSIRPQMRRGLRPLPDYRGDPWGVQHRAPVAKVYRGTRAPHCPPPPHPKKKRRIKASCLPVGEANQRRGRYDGETGGAGGEASRPRRDDGCRGATLALSRARSRLIIEARKVLYDFSSQTEKMEIFDFSV